MFSCSALEGSGANFKKGRRADPGALGERESLDCQIGPKFKLCTRSVFGAGASHAKRDPKDRLWRAREGRFAIERGHTDLLNPEVSPYFCGTTFPTNLDPLP